MRRLLSAVAVAGLVVLAGCSSDVPGVAAAPSSTDAHDLEHVEGLPSTAPASPTWDDQAAGDAWWIALAAMGEFAHPERDPQLWYELLAGYLTGDAQQAFYGVDPSTVPVRAVDGATVTEGGSPYLAEAVVATDAGPYRVLLVREGAGRAWKVDRLEPAR